jgi:anti-repressor protein
MNELQTSNMKTPIEIALGVDENGMTTAKKLYEFLELDSRNYSRWCKTNIVENEFADENVDYWAFVIDEERNFNPNPTTDYKLTAHFAKKLSMKGNGERAEQARQYFITIEDRAKQEVINRSQLSPQMQMVMQMAESMARQELEQKRQAEKVNRIEQTVSNMKDIFTKPIGDWKSEINGRIREISVKSGIGYQTLYGQLYGELETTAHCSLNMLQRNKINKMKKAGNNETAIKNGTTKIQIIYEKPQLKAIFEGIVKNYAMRYCS